MATQAQRGSKYDDDVGEDGRTRSKGRQKKSEDDEIEIETKKVDVDDEDDGSSSDEAPEMVVQSDAKELERRRMEMEHMQRVR